MIPFVLKYWKLILGGLTIAVLGLLLMLQKSETRHWNKLYLAEQSARQLEQAEVRKVRAEQKAADADHARKVEQVQTQVSNEVSHAYQSKLADLKRRYDALRVQSGTDKAPSSSSGGANVPSVPSTTSGSDAAPAPGEDDFNAAANFLQLEALQKWLRDQLTIER